MILYINTTKKDLIELTLKEGQEILGRKEIKSDFDQAQKLLPGIEGILNKVKKSLSDLKGIEVENKGGSFTSLRIGVVTANALGFALGIPVIAKEGGQKKGKDFDIAEPRYDREPNIGKKK